MIRAAAFVATLLVVSPALADDDVATLATDLDHQVAALSTSDCASACKALGSIRRAADKICALEPGGSRCDAARTKADDATKRVREACPDCAEAAMTPAPTEAKTAPAAAPPAEAERGGCHCNVATTPDAGDFAVLALALAVLVEKRRCRV